MCWFCFTDKEGDMRRSHALLERHSSLSPTSSHRQNSLSPSSCGSGHWGFDPPAPVTNSLSTLSNTQSIVTHSSTRIYLFSSDHPWMLLRRYNALLKYFWYIDIGETRPTTTTIELYTEIRNSACRVFSAQRHTHTLIYVL